MINKVILVGNVGKDPEVKHLDNGTAVAQFSLATSESYKDKEGKKVVNTEWHNIVAWRGLADVAEKYIKKGQPLYIEGKIKSRSYEDKDGVKRYVTDIHVLQMQMLGSKPANESSDVPQTESTEGSGDQPLETDDLPF